ncbi:MAG: hypothetical protein CVU39_20610 [Chloroflexi bacterium HGW-Chloroflexi-10]|nr:MAG: hypothetical protein CVU39_20610 [Chloroflexi bacterium HGW-Chloroflexi-10]
MSIWDNYPDNYRKSEIEQISASTNAGESIAIYGLSGSGKSNLLGYFCNRILKPNQRLWIDGNRLREKSSIGFIQLFLKQILKDNSSLDFHDPYLALEEIISQKFINETNNLVIVIDRLDLLSGNEFYQFCGNLRALRDQYKYKVCYVIGTRKEFLLDNELAELMIGNAFWLGPLSKEDAYWSIQTYAQRKKRAWSEVEIELIYQQSCGYPSFLRAVCEAYFSGCPLTQEELLKHPAIKLRLLEFNQEMPTLEMLKQSKLLEHPWLKKADDLQEQLTDKENKLLQYFQANPMVVLEKELLIQTVWSEDRIYQNGVRDDSLAQLIRRLRKKIERNPNQPQHIHTIPGRGYKFTP